MHSDKFVCTDSLNPLLPVPEISWAGFSSLRYKAQDISGCTTKMTTDFLMVKFNYVGGRHYKVMTEMMSKLIEVPAGYVSHLYTTILEVKIDSISQIG